MSTTIRKEKLLNNKSVFYECKTFESISIVK